MRQGLLVLALVVSSGCSLDPQVFCEDTLTVACERQQTCNQTAFDILFRDVAQCVAAASLLIDCTGRTTDNACRDGEVYDGVKASACIRQKRSESCEQDGTGDACELVCTSS